MDMSSPDHSNKDMFILSIHVQKMSGFESLPPELKLVCLLQEKQQASHLKERRQAGDERKQEKKQAVFEREVEGKRAAQERALATDERKREQEVNREFFAAIVKQSMDLMEEEQPKKRRRTINN